MTYIVRYTVTQSVYLAREEAYWLARTYMGWLYIVVLGMAGNNNWVLHLSYLRTDITASTEEQCDPSYRTNYI